MLGYTILEKDNVPEVLKNKPRWMAGVIIALMVLTIVTSAVAAGAFIGYTYCYLERQQQLATGSIAYPKYLQKLNVPYILEAKSEKNRSINSAIYSTLVTRILKIGHAVLEKDTLDTRHCN